MKARESGGRRELLLLAAASALLGVSCPSGLEGTDSKGTTDLPTVPVSTNGRFGVDPCVVLTDPITDIEVCGGVIPTNAGSRERPVAFVAFVTRTQIEDPDDLTTDANGLEDVFVAAIDCDSVDPRAFVHSMAGTMRHPRCVTCHQMNVDVVQDPSAMAPTAFVTQQHFSDGGGQPPLNAFGDATCRDCHFEDWQAPGPTFDLRRAGALDLFFRAQAPPSGLEQHFRNDPRVLWALDSGQTPFGAAADDDHDGVDEPEDHDGVRRHVPGGKRAFLARLDDFLATADPTTGELLFSSAEAAVQDVVLASRAAAGNQAGDGTSSSPSIVYEPNPGFDPGNPGMFAAGTLHLAFQSDSGDMAGGTEDGFFDVFRVTIDVVVTAMGTIDLSYRAGSQVHVSESVNLGEDARGDSTDPHIGANGDRIAFVSSAFDLIAGLRATCRPEVYLWDEAVGTSLVSHVPGNLLTPGDAGAIRPALSLDGMAVCFESEASNIVAGDTNGTRDVFYALWPALDVQRASVTDAGGEFEGHATAASIHHAGGQVRVAFAVQENPLPPVAAVQCPDEVVVLTPTKDTHVREDAPDSSFEPDPFPPMGGNGFDLYVGATGAASPPGRQRRSLIAFDVAANIPAGATINEVTLSIVVNQQAGDLPTPGACDTTGPVDNLVELHTMNVDWPEVGATWNTVLGDQDPTISSQFLIQTIGLAVWPSTAQLAADVQSWLDDPSSNFGWMLLGTDAACTAKRLNSSQHATRPQLTVDYSPPPPPLPLGNGTGASSVFLRDTALGRTLELNQAVSPDGTMLAEELDLDGTPLPATATSPVISPNGDAVLFESMAQNLDLTRPFDENRLMDVMLVDLLQLDAQGFVLPYRLSVTADGGDANGPSHSPRFGVFTPPTDAFPLGLALYATQATNLGNTDPGDLDGDGVPEADNFMLAFLSEGGSVIADFEAEPARQGMGRNVVFQSRSSGEPTSFLWDFGDGTPTSTKRSPRHAYSDPGFYTVQLTVSGPLGTDERTRIDYVHVLDAVMATFATTKDASDAPDQAPATDVPFTTTVAGAIDDADPSSVLRLDMRSSGSTEFPDQFEWTLARVDAGGAPLGPDVLVSEEADPQDVPIDATGFYDLTLEATGPGGAGMATQRIEVYQRVTASFTTDPMGSPVRGPAPLMAQFFDTSSGDLLDADAHLWDFGDGASSMDAAPMHTFAEGVWFVDLTVSGKGTDTDVSSTLPVIADGIVTAVFTAAPQPAGSVAGLLAGEAIDEGSGVLVDFENLSQHEAGAPLFHRWNFGTGVATGQEMAEDPTGILYTLFNRENVQAFVVSLVTSTNDPAPASCLGQPAGTCDERSGTVTVYPRPMVSVIPPGPSHQPTGEPLRPPHAVDLAGTVIGDGTGTDPLYRWLRSEANQTGATIEFATGLALEFEFPDPGVYEVVLEVETNGPGGSRQTVQSAPETVTVSASTLTEWILQAVQAPGARCLNCHAGPNPPAQLNWEGTPSEIHERIVEVLSQNCDPSRQLIDPFLPDDSVVYNVLLSPSGPLCPINMRINLPGDETDKDAHVAVIRSWILGGALDD